MYCCFILVCRLVLIIIFLFIFVVIRSDVVFLLLLVAGTVLLGLHLKLLPVSFIYILPLFTQLLGNVPNGETGILFLDSWAMLLAKEQES